MLATSFRPHFAILSALVVATLAIAVWPRGQCTRSQRTLQQSVALADGFYRAGHFEAAEHELRIAAEHQPIAKAEQLHVVASFYRQLGHALAEALESAKRGPSTMTLRWVDQAIQLDGMLGGAFTSDLNRIRRSAYLAIGGD